MADLQVLDGGAAGSGAVEGGTIGTRTGGGARVRHLRPVRERAAGPCLVRPLSVAPQVRPAVPPCPSPARRALPQAESRLLARPVRMLPPHIVRGRRVAATVGMAVLSMLVVLLLGLLADVAAAARAGAAEEPVTERSLTSGVPASGQGIAALPR